MLNSTVRKKIVVAKGLIVLQVEPDDKNFSFEPGQYATLGLMGGAPRPAEFLSLRAHIPRIMLSFT
jgi:NAD(P)H-flavin reductase